MRTRKTDPRARKPSSRPGPGQAVNPGIDQRLWQEVFRAACELFGQPNAIRWLTSPSLALGGRTPRELCATAKGRREVLAELASIEHGFCA
ncbi:MAG: DUF2384 domain-containing protein [Candidatus Solibacter usitatus]|nr:DUF2384 domain-containing protein [Candidatus Solibacter usitatus]